MSKKRAKKTATSRKTTRRTDAPKVLARPSVEAPIDAVIEAPIEAAIDVPSEVAIAVASEVAIDAPVAAAPPDRAQIARLAFAKFVARGWIHGFHVEDWLTAEAELIAARGDKPDRSCGINRTGVDKPGDKPDRS